VKEKPFAYTHDHLINSINLQVAFWKFDDCGAVLKYDAWIPNLNDWIVAGLGLQISNPQIDSESIDQLCYGTQQRCTGANTQWDSTDQCVETLSQKPYGNYDEAWGDNIVCRTIHLVLTQVRPDVSWSFSQFLVSHPRMETKFLSNRYIVLMSDLPGAANAWIMLIHLNTSPTKLSMEIQSERLSRATIVNKCSLRVGYNCFHVIETKSCDHLTLYTLSINLLRHLA